MFGNRGRLLTRIIYLVRRVEIFNRPASNVIYQNAPCMV
ncbi:hypothetical protein BZA02_11467 [Ruegeria sp. P4]|jgi:hypothetical protein|nr:hypothetical protein BZA02_11467 [Ruegeria sp. P4]